MTLVVGKRDDCRFGSDSFKEVWGVSTLSVINGLVADKVVAVDLIQYLLGMSGHLDWLEQWMKLMAMFGRPDLLDQKMSRRGCQFVSIG